MELHSDFTRRVAVHAAQLPWVASPMAGVERRMLDRIADELARATSIVRYAPVSHFSSHTHGGGEEFLVLEGVFEDEYGEFPADSYVRNPPTSRHTPGSAPGCILFVKLWQFDPADRRPRGDQHGLICLPCRRRPTSGPAAAVFCDSREDVRLERWAPGAAITLTVSGGAEVLVLDGAFDEGGEHFEAQSWLRLPAGGVLQAKAGAAGCRVWTASA